MKCTNCNNELHPDSSSCYLCGYKVITTSSQPIPQNNTTTTINPPLTYNIISCQYCGGNIHPKSSVCISCGKKQPKIKGGVFKIVAVYLIIFALLTGNVVKS